MATLKENILQAISDFDSIKEAIIECGVDVPHGTDTKEYGNLVRKILQNIPPAPPADEGVKINVASFPAMVNSDVFDGLLNNEIVGFVFDSEDHTKNPLPENAIVFDVGIVLNDDTEIRRNQMKQPSYFGDSIIEICSPLVFTEDYYYPVFRVIDIDNLTFTQPLYDTIMIDGYKQLNVYYI